MEDCWLEIEEFNFDIPLELSPLSGEKSDSTNKTGKDESDDYDDEVFFGPVGHLERCAAVAIKKETVEPLKPLEPAEQALLLQESAKLSCLLKLKPLDAIQNHNPKPMVYSFKRESSGIDINKLKLFREKISSKEDKENLEIDGKKVNTVESRPEVSPVKEKKQVGKSVKKDDTYVSKSSSSPSCKSRFSNRQSLTGSGGGKMPTSKISIPVGTGASKIQSRIARPSSIPSLKPGLLQGQTRLRGAPSQESKLKPLKAMKSAGSTLLHQEPKTVAPSKSSIPSMSVNKLVTPKKIGTAKHVRSNSSDSTTRRKSTDLSTSMSQLQFSKPNHNSTPIQQHRPAKQSSTARRSIGSAATSMRNSSYSMSTPAKTKPGKSVGSVNKEKIKDSPSSSRPTSSRRSLVPKPNSNHGDTPLRAKSGQQQRRGSLLKYPNTKLSPDKKKNTDGNTSMVRSDTFVLSGTSGKPSDKQTRKQTGKGNESLIDIDISEPKSSAVAPVASTRSSDEDSIASRDMPDALQRVLPDTLNDNITPLIHQADILVPEVPTVYMSPLLKFDSPLPDSTTSDPFTTGNTPPSLPVGDGVLAPEQMEANLIQF